VSEVQAFGRVKSIYDSLPTKACWIAGGAMRSFLVGERLNDLDIFSSDPTATEKTFQADPSYKAGFNNDFIANFYKDGFCHQVIKKYTYPNQQATIEAFDFTIVCASVGPDGIVADERFYIDNTQRRLVVKSLPKPLSTVKRAMKYTGRGYVMYPVSLAKILKAVQENQIDWINPSQNEIEFYPDGTPTFRGLD